MDSADSGRPEWDDALPRESNGSLAGHKEKSALEDGSAGAHASRVVHKFTSKRVVERRAVKDDTLWGNFCELILQHQIGKGNPPPAPS